MTYSLFLRWLLVILIGGIAYPALAQKTDSRYFEMRTYHCHEGKRPDLIKRFQDHTVKLFEKSGIENIAYFLPVDESNNTLTFILAYPNRESRDRLWNTFANDPEWKAVFKQSEANGPLLTKIDQTFMTLAPELSSGIAKLPSEERIFELRTYFLHPGRVDAINARFRDHTRALFERHGMTNVVYWYTVEPDNAQPKLVYLLAHKGVEEAKNSFDKFRDDPDWKRVRDASEVSGPIVERIESKYFKTLPFSPLK
ncbi:MAG: NIPSNAP family protein [Cyclobacteriaceae bacterium]|nr:NIPSNAP family protein [Cyclobacteriaceae bacterium]UYN88551.1 MAG: NIPSNAP family protein [Cyclobacteriaceae bacterium]